MKSEKTREEEKIISFEKTCSGISLHDQQCQQISSHRCKRDVNPLLHLEQERCSQHHRCSLISWMAYYCMFHAFSYFGPRFQRSGEDVCCYYVVREELDQPRVRQIR